MSKTQTVPVTAMQRNYNEVLAKLEAGPVIMIQRSKTVAVMLKPEDYDKLIQQAQQLQTIQTNQAFPHISAGDYVGSRPTGITAQRIAQGEQENYPYLDTQTILDQPETLAALREYNSGVRYPYLGLQAILDESDDEE